LILFPGDSELKVLKQCTTGVAFLLKFNTSSQRLFFWYQEKADQKAVEALVNKVNQLLKNGPPKNAGKLTGEVDEEAALMQLLASSSQETTTQSVSSPAIAHPPSPSRGSLSSVLTPELVKPVLNDEVLRQQLFPHLPPHHERTQMELENLIQSAQFQQAVSELDEALQSGDLMPVLQQLGLNVETIMASDDRVGALLRAIQQSKNTMDTD